MSLTNSIASATPNLVNAQWAFRNRIINGSCEIAQRGGATYLYGTSGYSGPDRFTAGNNMPGTGEFTQSQSTIDYNGVGFYTVLQTVTTAVAAFTGNYSWTGIQQRIEGFNCYDLKDQEIVISFIFYTNVTGTYSISIADGAAAYTYVAAFEATANTPVKVIIPVSMLPSTLTLQATTAVGLYLSIGGLSGTAQPNMNAWEAGNYAMAAGATNWAMTAGNFIALTQLQLEIGNDATPFENRPVTLEQSLCYRYFQMYSLWKNWGYGGAAGDAYGQTVMFQPMRTEPAIAYASVTYGNSYGLDIEDIYANSVSFYAYATAAGATSVSIYAVTLAAEL
jgi:hypothetical protein